MKTRMDELLNGASRIAVCGHLRPDGDCIGSTLGLRAYVQAIRPDIRADVWLDPFPESYQILPGADQVNTGDPSVRPDILFVMDCSDPNRIGRGRDLCEKAGKVICIDHHMTNGGFADENIIYPDYSSACEVLYTLLDEGRMNRDAAACLYTGIASDTGVFQYASVTEDTMRRAGKLISFGIDFPKILTETCFEVRFTHQKLMALALERMEIMPDGRGVVSWISQEDYKRLHSSVMETDGIVEQMRCTRGMDYSVLFYETEPGTYKISFRSRGATNVGEAARLLGGGGHKLAAGASLTGMDYEQMKQRVESVIRQAGEQKSAAAKEQGERR